MFSTHSIINFKEFKFNVNLWTCTFCVAQKVPQRLTVNDSEHKIITPFHPFCFFCVARGCGQCLNLNGSLILVLMLRQTLTFVRSTRVARLLPIDQHIIFHKTVGLIIAVLSLIHTVAHVGNAGKL